jgi:plastocyanin
MRKLLTLTVLIAVAAVVIAVPALAATPTLSVAVKDNFFSPKKKTIKTGTKVTWTWKGADDHNVTLAKAPKGVKLSSFKSPTQIKGKPFVRTLKVPGKYVFFCTIHSSEMIQTLTVTK